MGMHRYLSVLTSALVDDVLRQRLQLVIKAYDRVAAGPGAAAELGRGAAAAQGFPSEGPGSAVFAGGRAFSFGTFQLFPSQRLLLEGTRKAPITSRAFDLLTILVERAGEVVGKDELIARVWPNIFVDESNLKTQVCVLRRVLDESTPGKRYIVTIPGRGYNFVAPVSVAEAAAD
jgi:DNA-binding winged helix-turn-helix (wHTH) protein